MSEEPKQPEEQQDPREPAKQWLRTFEQFVRNKDFVKAGEMFHKNCVYYGLKDDRRIVDWSETWNKQQAFSIDLREVKIAQENNMLICCCPWMARSHIVHRGDLTLGRITVGLLLFKNTKGEERLLAVHFHNSLKP